MSPGETIERFDCFGGSCGVLAIGPNAHEAALTARARLLELHARFSRFIADSELSRVNADERRQVPVSGVMALLADAVRRAGARTGGLVDGTLLGEVERAGYSRDIDRVLPLHLALALAPPRRPAACGAGGWELVEVDLEQVLLTRPPGLRVDSGGIAKGLFADLIAEDLAELDSFAVDCCGDIAIGGHSGAERPIEVQSPFDESVLHTFWVRWSGVATSGIGRRAWLGADGRPAHHLLDPSTGLPAFTGVVQATALAPSALLAEIHAKAALLSGPEAAREWLPWGGLVVLDDGSHVVVEPDGMPVVAEPLG
jgi:thiamine biosynthesis lipoprotein